MTIIIEDNIPLPRRTVGRKTKYPLDQLEVGQSFVVPAKSPRRMASYAYTRGKKIGRRFAVRNVGSGVRVWRVA